MKINFIKNFLLIISAFLFFNLPSSADELTDVQTFFENYIKSANSYSKSVVNYYMPDARIIRVVVKPDGTKESVNFSMDRYKKELKKGLPLARLSKYKNKYTNKNFEKLGNGDYKITALRTPNGDKKGLPFYFIVTNTDDGWKVKEESMDTTVQKSLTSK